MNFMLERRHRPIRGQCHIVNGASLESELKVIALLLELVKVVSSVAVENRHQGVSGKALSVVYYVTVITYWISIPFSSCPTGCKVSRIINPEFIVTWSWVYGITIRLETAPLMTERADRVTHI